MSTCPRPEDYGTRAEYAWARKPWKHKHGGSLIGNVAAAVIAGAITGSPVAVLAFIALTVVVTLARRAQA